MHNRGYEQGQRCLSGYLSAVIDMPEVRMSVEEYLEIMRVVGQQGPGLVEKARKVKQTGKALAKEVKKQRSKQDKKMAAALKKANEMGRTKSGAYRKGYDQAKIMRKAHQLRRKM